MAAYMVIEIKIKDQESYSEYVDKVHDVVIAYGGKYLVRGGEITPMSDDWNPERIIIIEFQDRQQLQKCFQSQEYLAIAPLRERSTISKAIIVDGVLK